MGSRDKKKYGKKGSRKGIEEVNGKRKREIDEIPGDDLFYAAGGDAGGSDEPVEDEEEEEVENTETAEQKRLKIAKAYLKQLREDVEEEAEERSEGGGESDEEDVRNVIAQKLKQETHESKYWLDRLLADKVKFPASGVISEPTWRKKGPRLSVTDIAVTSDDATAFSVSKCGMIHKWDVETGKRGQLSFGPEGPQKFKFKGTKAGWVKRPAARVSKSCFLSAAVSSDGHFLAIGGGDSQIHIFDLRSEKYLRAFSGHQDAVSGVVFQDGTHDLFSSSFDRTVKSWSVDDMGYLDTCFGHQAEVLSIDMLRSERAITSSADRTCRLWKMHESSQLVFRSPAMVTDCCRFLNPGIFLSGSQSMLNLWTHVKKKPICTIENAHGNPIGGPGCLDEIEASWVQSVSTCRGADLAVSGAGDGLVRLWAVRRGEERFTGLDQIGGLAARGFVNGLHISRDGRVVVAGVGQEPKTGRWCVDSQAKNGVMAFRLDIHGD